MIVVLDGGTGIWFESLISVLSIGWLGKCFVNVCFRFLLALALHSIESQFTMLAPICWRCRRQSRIQVCRVTQGPGQNPDS
jgi:hypothetical protein